MTSATSIQKSYIQFDLSSIPAGFNGSNIAKATLKLYVNSVTTAGSFNVDYVTGPWAEKTITGNLSPSLGTTVVGSVPLTSALVHDYVLVDVTPAVGAWLNKTQANDGLVLVANSPLNATFDSKENTTQSHGPELDMVFTGGLSGATFTTGGGLAGGVSGGVLNVGMLRTCSTKQVLQWNGTAWVCSAAGAGTVTSVALAAPSSDFTLTGSPITTAGTLALGWTVAPTNAETPGAIVKRDFLGGFRAGPIVAIAQPAVPGVLGYNSNSARGAVAVVGQDANSGISAYTVGVHGDTSNPAGIGVFGTTGALSANASGLLDFNHVGIWGDSATTYGVIGTSDSGTGVLGESTSGVGVFGASVDVTGAGVWGQSSEGNGLIGLNSPSAGASD